MRNQAVAETGPDPATNEADAADLADAGVVKLASNLDLTAATDLVRVILAARGSDITLDASEVQHFGAQCAQILVSAKMTWKADGQPLKIVGSSADFIEGARLLGLQSALQDEDAHS